METTLTWLEKVVKKSVSVVVDTRGQKGGRMLVTGSVFDTVGKKRCGRRSLKLFGRFCEASRPVVTPRAARPPCSSQLPPEKRKSVESVTVPSASQ